MHLTSTNYTLILLIFALFLDYDAVLLLLEVLALDWIGICMQFENILSQKSVESHTQAAILEHSVNNIGKRKEKEYSLLY